MRKWNDTATYLTMIWLAATKTAAKSPITRFFQSHDTFSLSSPDAGLYKSSTVNKMIANILARSHLLSFSPRKTLPNITVQIGVVNRSIVAMPKELT